MTDTSPLRRSLAAAALTLSIAVPLAACGGNTAAPAGPFPYCYGPETPDDLEDLFDRDVVRVDDSVCASGAYPQGHGIAYAASWDDLPDVGEELDSDSEWGYHRSHRRAKSPTVVYVVKPAAPTRSVLVVREASVGSPRVRESVATRARTARQDPVVASSAQQQVSRSSSVTRGGLGSTGGADKMDEKTRREREAAASRAAEAGRKKAETSTKTTSQKATTSRKAPGK